MQKLHLLFISSLLPYVFWGQVLQNGLSVERETAFATTFEASAGEGDISGSVHAGEIPADNCLVLAFAVRELTYLPVQSTYTDAEGNFSLQNA